MRVLDTTEILGTQDSSNCPHQRIATGLKLKLSPVLGADDNPSQLIADYESVRTIPNAGGAATASP